MIKIYGGFILLAAVASVGAFNFSAETLRCSGIDIKPVSALKSDPAHPCKKIRTADSWEDSDFDTLSLAEECLCNLVPHQAVWKAMVTPNVMTIFQAILEAMDTRKDNYFDEKFPLDNERNWLEAFERRTLKERREARSDNFLRRYFMTVMGERVARHPRDRGSPEVQRKVKKILKNSCGRLSKMLTPFLDYFQAVGRLINNEGLTNMVTSYDHNLFKALVAHRTCKHVEDAYVDVD